MELRELGGLPRSVNPIVRFVTAAALLGGIAPATVLARGDDKPLPAETVSDLLASFEQAMTHGTDCGESCMAQGKCTDACIETQELRRHVAVTLRKSPSAWGELCPALGKKFMSPDTPALVKTRMLDFLAQGAHPEMVVLATRLHGSDASAFSSDHLLAFAAQGSKEFAAALEKAYETEECDGNRVLIAAFLAGKGDARGKELLEAAVETGCRTEGGIARAIIAAEALEHFGAPERTPELLAAARDEALAALDAGDLPRARRIALEAAFARESVKAPYPRLPFFHTRLQWRVGFGAHELTTNQEVFELAQKLAG